MEKQKAVSGWGSSARSVFDGQLQTLMGVVGHEFGPNELRKVDIANCLGVDATGLSQRLSGRTKVTPQEYAKLIDKFGLNAKGIDFSIFEIETRDAFLDVLRRHEVGTFDGTGASLLRRHLDDLTKRSTGLSVSFNRIALRGLTHPERVESNQRVVRRGEQVQIRIKSKTDTGRIGVFETPLCNRLRFTILAPSIVASDTSVSGGQLNIPNTEVTDNWLTVGNIPGPHRLFVIQAPGQVIDFLFETKSKPSNEKDYDFASLSDERQRDLRRLIALEDANVLAAAMDYVAI